MSITVVNINTVFIFLDNLITFYIITCNGNIFKFNHIFLMVIYVVNCILVIVGTVVGAGFASGKEIFTFFNVYGFYGLLGLILSISFMGIIIYKALKIIVTYDISSYSSLINTIVPKFPFIDTVFCYIINLFLFISFIVMVAGFSAYFAQEFCLPIIFGAIIIGILSFFTFLNSINGIIKINKIFIPCLFFMIILLGLNNINCFICFKFSYCLTKFNWFLSCLLYSSYNLIVIFPILIGLKKYISNIKQAKLIAILSCLCLLSVAIILFFLINFYFPQIMNLDLPTVFIASTLGNIYKYICGFAILGAIFTTAISSGYGFLTNLNITNRKVYISVAIFMCVISILLSNLGFSNLLNMLYPILGFVRISADNFCFIFCEKILKYFLFIDINM